MGIESEMSDCRDPHRVILEHERARLGAVLQQMPVGVVIADASGAIEFVNQRAVEILGQPRSYAEAGAAGVPIYDEERLGQAEGQARFGEEKTPLRRALAGETVFGHQSVYRREDGRSINLRISARALRGADAAMSGAVLVFVDVTEEKRAEDQERLLARVGAYLGRSLDYERTLETLVWMAVPRLADWCVVDVIDDESESLRRAAAAHVDESCIDLLYETKRRYPYQRASASGVANVIETGQTRVFNGITQEGMLAGGVPPGEVEMVMRIGISSSIIAPLRAHGRSLGAITFGRMTSACPFDDHEVRLAEDLAYRAAFAIDNARLYHAELQARRQLDALYARERDLVKVLGKSFLGSPPAEGLSVDVAVDHLFASEAQRVGGDYHDVIGLDDGRCLLVVGDVCGKGTKAAVHVAAAKYLLRAFAHETPSPAVLLGRLNRALCRELGKGGLFVTLTCVLIDPHAKTLTCANAGHPPPVYHPGGSDASVCRLLTHGGVLGASPTFTYDEVTVPFEGGAVVVLFTDGVSEADGVLDPTGDGGVGEIVQASLREPARCIVDRVLAMVRDNTQGSPRDDLAVAAATAR